IHAGRSWNSKIVWLLWTKRESMNSRIATLQLALGERCRVFSAEGCHVLAELAELNVGSASIPNGALVASIKAVLARCPTVRLAAAFLRTPDPIGAAEEIRESVSSYLAEQISLDHFESEKALELLHLIAQGSAEPETKLRAIERGMAL